MSGIAIYLYVMGALLSVQYSWELGDRVTVGAVLFVLLWPVFVPVIWVASIIKSVIDAVRA
jgi:hypothetical protein